MEASKVSSENVYGEKWDRCLSETLVKIGTGTAIGAVLSLIVFKRKAWPVVLGLGTGLGMGYANCQHDFQHPNLVHGKIKKVEDSK